MAGLEGMLKKHLYRALCPDPVELGEYRLGTMPSQQAEAIQNHLTECSHCRSELQLLEDYLDALTPEIAYSLGERVKIWIARLLPQTGPPAYAFAVRGEESSQLLRYHFGEEDTGGELAVQIQEDPLHPERKVILGLLTGIFGKGLRAELWQKGEVQFETTVDESGNLALANLLAGEYKLLIRGGDFEICVQDLKV